MLEKGSFSFPTLGTESRSSNIFLKMENYEKQLSFLFICSTTFV